MIYNIMILFLIFSGILAQKFEIQENSIEINAKGEFAFVENEFKITGNGLSGYLDLTEKKIVLNYDLWNLETGIRLRDEHMHSIYLETEDYPNINFTAELSFLADDSVKAEGNFKLHGVNKNIIAFGTLKENNLRARFSIKLSDFNIEIPRKFSIAKLSENLDILIKAVLLEKK